MYSYKLNPCGCGSTQTPDLDSDDMVPSWGVRCPDCSQFQHGRDWGIEQAVEKWNQENPLLSEEESFQEHEFLLAETHCEVKRVESGRTTKQCEHCKGEIAKGRAHLVHQFHDGNWFSYPTHIRCEAPFMKSLKNRK